MFLLLWLFAVIVSGIYMLVASAVFIGFAIVASIIIEHHFKIGLWA